MVAGTKERSIKEFQRQLLSELDRLHAPPARRAAWIMRKLRERAHPHRPDVTPQGVSKWVRGEAIPEEHRLRALCAACGFRWEAFRPHGSGVSDHRGEPRDVRLHRITIMWGDIDDEGRALVVQAAEQAYRASTGRPFQEVKSVNS